MNSSDKMERRLWLSVLVSILLFGSLLADYSFTLLFSYGDILNGEANPILRFMAENGWATEWVIVSSALIAFSVFGILNFLRKYDFAFKALGIVILYISVIHVFSGLTWYVQSTEFSVLISVLSVGMILTAVFVVMNMEFHSPLKAIIASMPFVVVFTLLMASVIVPSLSPLSGNDPGGEVNTWVLDFKTEPAGDSETARWTNEGESEAVPIELDTHNLTTMNLFLEWEDDTSRGRDLAGEPDTLRIDIESPDGRSWSEEDNDGAISMQVHVEEVPEKLLLVSKARPNISYFRTETGLGDWKFTVTVVDSPGTSGVADLDDGNSWLLCIQWFAYRGELKLKG